MIELQFDEAKPLLNPADVALFRGKSIASALIKCFTISTYSHVGLIDIVNGQSNEPLYELIEVREWHGGRAICLEKAIEEQKDCSIDIYRSIPYFLSQTFNPTTKEIILEKKEFQPKKVTKTFRKLLGCMYGWKRILWIWKYHAAGLRFFTNKKKFMDDTSTEFYPICSSAVSYAFSSCGYDLIYNKGDGYTCPGDLANSTRLSYLFTICK